MFIVWKHDNFGNTGLNIWTHASPKYDYKVHCYKLRIYVSQILETLYIVFLFWMRPGYW